MSQTGVFEISRNRALDGISGSTSNFSKKRASASAASSPIGPVGSIQIDTKMPGRQTAGRPPEQKGPAIVKFGAADLY